KKTLPFELEPLLPLPVEKVVVDYLPLPGEGLLVAAVEKEKIRKILSAVEGRFGEVTVIDVSSSTLVLPFLERKALTGVGIVLDIGASSTFAAFYEKNTLIQIRSFAFGGNTVTAALAQDLSCSIAEAESAKIDAGYGTNITEATAVCRQFCVSLKTTIEFMLLNETLHSSPTQIMVTGSGALFEPLTEELEKNFRAPVTVLDTDRIGQMEIDRKLQGRYQPSIMNTALSNVKRAFASRKSFNFIQGEFTRKSIGFGLKKELRWGTVVLGIMLFALTVDLVLDYQVEAKQADALKSRISQIFKKYYPPPAVMVDPVQQLKTKLAEDKKIYGAGDGNSEVNVLEILKDMSGLISPSLDVQITHFHYENNVVLVKGEAKKIDDVTSVKDNLSKSKYFKNVVINSTSLDREGARVNFDLRIELL
ncbi:MAG: pilus assembly protein PilM, partial [Smithellaceae bacterium]|nr:pilus assembly protein PilM [Smithellaceae bacterium]